MIYFVTIVFSQSVHAVGYGFTRTFHAYAWAQSPEDATSRATAHYESKTGVAVERAEAREALQQDIGTYTFPNQIIDVPREAVEAIWDHRKYSAELRTELFRSGLELA